MNGPPGGDGRAGAVERAVELGDLDGLTHLIDRLCHAGDWDGLLELRDRSRAAAARGRQLWPAAANAEYRLALQAPGPWAAAMLEPGTGRFALGPLAEVAAASHAWTELAPHAPAGPVATLAAHERVLRGDDLVGAPGLDPLVLDLPLVLQPWEPAYALAEYEPDRARFPSPPPPETAPVTLPGPGSRLADTEATTALRDLVGPWTSESDGRAEAVAVVGDALAAVAALGPPTARVAELAPGRALAHVAWAAASGGAHGRRRGSAMGRFGAWWLVAALAHRLDDWPLAPDEMGRAAAGLRWLAWDAGEPTTGWSLHLAVADPAAGRAWALAATDAD